jgi:hypothetical protein
VNAGPYRQNARRMPDTPEADRIRYELASLGLCSVAELWCLAVSTLWGLALHEVKLVVTLAILAAVHIATSVLLARMYGARMYGCRCCGGMVRQRGPVRP